MLRLYLGTLTDTLSDTPTTSVWEENLSSVTPLVKAFLPKSYLGLFKNASINS